MGSLRMKAISLISPERVSAPSGSNPLGRTFLTCFVLNKFNASTVAEIVPELSVHDIRQAAGMVSILVVRLWLKLIPPFFLPGVIGDGEVEVSLSFFCSAVIGRSNFKDGETTVQTVGPMHNF